MPRQARLTGSWQLVTVVGAALAFLLGAIVAAPRPASATSCSEATKFVEELTSNLSTGTDTYFGNQGSAVSFNHLPLCGSNGAGVRESFFMRLSPDYSNFVETGIAQLSGDSSSQAHSWGEWVFFPAPVQQFFYDSQAGVLTTGTTYSIRLQNGTGNSWDLYIAHTSSPGSSWNHVDNTGDLVTYKGTPESELSRYGTGDASDDVTSLQEQDTFLGSYVGWQHLGCDNAVDSIHDWAVDKVSNSAWFMVPSAPGPGQC